jgi:hypothetical protein
MKKMASYFFLLCCSITLLCSCESKNYSVEVSDGIVKVKMRSPSIGVAGINVVSFDGFEPEEVEKEVFDKIRKRSYDGNYSVIVTLEFKDSYGNYYDGTPVTVTSLNGAEVKRYASYGYFRNSTHLEKAYPWIHNYN